MNPEKKRPEAISKKRVSSKAQSAHAARHRRRWPLWLVSSLVIVIAAGTVLIRDRSSRPTATSQSTTAPAHGTTPMNAEPFAATNPQLTADHHDNEGDSMSEAEKAIALLGLGNDLLAAGKPEQAVRYFQHALIHDPNSEDTHYNLGIAFGRAGRTDEAIQHYREALKMLPDYPEAHNNLGNLLVKQGQLDAAIEHFSEALQIDPDSASAHNNLGTALARLGKVSEAIVHFSKAARLMPGYVDAHFNLGSAYLTQGRADEAIQEFILTLRLQPDFAPALRALQKAQRLQSSR